jgi:CHASE2 domain-containing sensor protein
MARSAALRRHYQTIVVVGAAIVVAWISLVASDRINLIDGLLYDLSLAATGKRPGTTATPVAVIALDRDSLADPELSALPRAFLSPIWAKIVNGLVASDAKAIGFDMIFEYSVNRLPGSDGQYDTPFLEALRRARNRVVIGRSGHSLPAAPFIGAVLDTGAASCRSIPTGSIAGSGLRWIPTAGRRYPPWLRRCWRKPKPRRYRRWSGWRHALRWKRSRPIGSAMCCAVWRRIPKP